MTVECHRCQHTEDLRFRHDSDDKTWVWPMCCGLYMALVTTQPLNFPTRGTNGDESRLRQSAECLATEQERFGRLDDDEPIGRRP